MSAEIHFDLTSLRRAYADGTLTPVQVVEEVLRRADDPEFPHVWIEKLGREQLLAMNVHGRIMVGLGGGGNKKRAWNYWI